MKMDWLRTSLIAGIALVCFLLMIRWGEFQERNQPQLDQTTISGNTADLNGISEVPSVSTSPATTDNQIPGVADQVATTNDGWIGVTTDVLCADRPTWRRYSESGFAHLPRQAESPGHAFYPAQSHRLPYLCRSQWPSWSRRNRQQRLPATV